MGTLIVLALIVLGLFLGIMLMALFSMAKRSDQPIGFMYRDEEIDLPSNHLDRLVSPTPARTSRGETRSHRELNVSVAAS